MPRDAERTRRWIVGLGNPGRKYERSRHNVGFWIVDRFAREAGAGGERRKFQALYGEHDLDIGREICRVVVVKPQTYMNLSGNAVRDLLGYFGETLSEDLSDRLLIVYDDLDLPEGRIRLRARGSAGGHRGVASVIQCLGHDRFARLRVGIGRPDGADAADFVLEKVDSRTRERFEEVETKAVEILSVWIRSGIQTCMNAFNVRERATRDEPGEPPSSDQTAGEAGET